MDENPNTPAPNPQTPAEPHLLFREATTKATKNVGGHMDGFLLLYTYRGALPQERLCTYEMGGDATIQSDLFFEAAAMCLRRIAAKTNNDLAAALAVFEGEVVKKFLTTKQIPKGPGGT